MTTKISHGASGAIRRFAGWVARGSVGYPLFEDGRPEGHPEVESYLEVLHDEATAIEVLFAVFVNNLELDEAGEPINEKHAERRAATYLYEYMTRDLPSGEPPVRGDEAALY